MSIYFLIFPLVFVSLLAFGYQYFLMKKFPNVYKKGEMLSKKYISYSLIQSFLIFLALFFLIMFLAQKTTVGNNSCFHYHFYYHAPLDGDFCSNFLGKFNRSIFLALTILFSSSLLLFRKYTARKNPEMVELFKKVVDAKEDRVDGKSLRPKFLFFAILIFVILVISGIFICKYYLFNDPVPAYQAIDFPDSSGQ